MRAITLTLEERDRIACIVWPELAQKPYGQRLNHCALVSAALAMTPAQVKQIHHEAEVIAINRGQEQEQVK